MLKEKNNLKDKIIFSTPINPHVVAIILAYSVLIKMINLNISTYIVTENMPRTLKGLKITILDRNF